MKFGGYRIRLKSYADLFIPILFAAVLIYYMAGSRRILHTDAMIFIKPVGFLMALSLLFVIKQELVIQKIDDNLAIDKEIFFTKEEFIKFVGFALLVLLYIFGLPYAGFIAATLVFPVVAMLFGGVRSVKILILAPVILTTCIYVLFKIFLMVPLPIGVLGI